MIRLNLTEIAWRPDHMNDVQRRLLSLLKEIDDICQANGIEYYIDGGTALGAIRHRGFLPWDDDADIMLTRDNWEKFRRVMQQHPRPDRKLEDLYSNNEYTMVYGRYCDTSTTCILRTSMIDQFQSGLFIDMFILDPVPDTPESKKEYFDILHGYCEYLNPYYYDDIVGVNEWYDYFRKLGAQQGRKAVIEFVEKRLFSYPDQDGMTYGFRYDRGSWFYPRDVVGHGRRVMVEGISLPIAAKPEDYMRIHYGDHWQMIPSATEAETHNVAIDLNVPYQTFTENYMGLINKKKSVQVYNRQHDLAVRGRKASAVVDAGNYNISAKLFARLIDRRLEKLGTAPMALLQARRYDELRTLLGNYYDMQLNRWFLFYKVLIPLNDELLFCALYLMLIDGLYSKADKILTLRRRQEAPLTDELRAVEDIIASLRRCVICFEQSDWRQALQISNDQLRFHPDIHDFTENALCAQAGIALEESDAALANTLIRQIRAQEENVLCRDNVQAALAMLEARFTAGEEKEQALLVLRGLQENSRNGMLRLAAMDFLNNTNEIGGAVHE